MQPLILMLEQLNSKIESFKHALDLCSAVESDEYSKLAIRVDHEMNGVLRELHLLKLQTQSEKENLMQLQELRVQCESFKDHLVYTSSNLPPRLPQPRSTKPAEIEVKKDVQLDAPPTISYLTDCEYLRLLTTDQYESIPKYMKGRLQFDKVNSLIEKLNGVYVEKYKVLRQKKKGMDDRNRKRCESYRLQENKDTKGIHFIVDKDIEDFTSLKMDKTMQNILTMLRHCGLMHEIRGCGYVRYACYSY